MKNNRKSSLSDSINVEQIVKESVSRALTESLNKRYVLTAELVETNEREVISKRMKYEDILQLKEMCEVVHICTVDKHKKYKNFIIEEIKK